MDKDFLSNISTFDYVSFDVFDTLLFRTTSHYKDVFDLVELTYNKNIVMHYVISRRLEFWLRLKLVLIKMGGKLL